MTEPNALERLQVEEEERKAKKVKTACVQKRGKATKGQKIKCSKKLYSRIVPNESSSSEGELPELDRATTAFDITGDKEVEEPLQTVNMNEDLKGKFVAAVYDSKWYIAKVQNHDRKLN